MIIYLLINMKIETNYIKLNTNIAPDIMIIRTARFHAKDASGVSESLLRSLRVLTTQIPESLELMQGGDDIGCIYNFTLHGIYYIIINLAHDGKFDLEESSNLSDLIAYLYED